MVEGGVTLEFNLPANVHLSTGADYGAASKKGDPQPLLNHGRGRNTVLMASMSSPAWVR